METVIKQTNAFEDPVGVAEGIMYRDNIASDTFTPTGKHLGYGCWGSVSEYVDPSGQRWALKRFAPNEIAVRQMKERNLTEEGVMRKEAIPLSAAQHHVVPRIIERDKCGKMFIGMPVYNQTLERRLNDYQPGPILDNTNLMKDIVEALAYLHDSEQRAHGDLKPANIFVDKGRAFVSDLGSSTCISISQRSKDPRDRIGDKNYRAPECFQDESHPSERSDVFSFGSLVYQMLTGDRLYEGIKDVDSFTKEEYEVLRKKKLKKVPHAFRRLVKKATEYEPYSRQSGGNELRKELEEAIGNLDSWAVAGRTFKKGMLYMGLPLGMLGLCLVGATLHEPQELNLPSIQPRVHGILYKPESGTKEDINFETEKICDLPHVESVGQNVANLSRLATDNRVVAYLLKTHQQAVWQLKNRPEDGYSELEFEAFRQHTTPEERKYIIETRGPWYPVVAKAIEVGLNESLMPNGKVDLEDVCAVTRIGKQTVKWAKLASNSGDYQTYRDAKDRRGNRIIPLEERNFVDTWLSYFHSDLD